MKCVSWHLKEIFVNKTHFFFLRFCRTWTKRYLITSQTRLKKLPNHLAALPNHLADESQTYRRKDDNRRLRVEIAIRAIANEFTIAWQSHLRAKMAIHGSASELNRIKMKTCEWKWLLTGLRINSTAWCRRSLALNAIAVHVETETCFTCDCEQGRFCHDLGAGYGIETCNPLRLCGASSANHEVGGRNAIESCLTKQALEVLRGPLVHDIGAIYANENCHLFNEL